MLKLVQFYDPSVFPFKVGPIIWDDLLWYSKLTDDVVLYEPGHILGL